MVMNEFVDKYRDRIHGVLNCFDRMLFRGYLPIMSGWAMAEFLNSLDLKFSNLKPFLMENAQRVKDHALAMATKHNRPYVYLQGKIRMEDAAKEMAKRDGITAGLVCIFSIVQPCRSFAFRFEKGRPFVQSAKRKCLHLYFYFIDREFGLIHVQLQTWFPMQIQVYLNGHEWLARQLERRASASSVTRIPSCRSRISRWRNASAPASCSAAGFVYSTPSPAGSTPGCPQFANRASAL